MITFFADYDGLLMVYGDVAAEHEEECNRWYNEEHIPEGAALLERHKNIYISID
jgi:hypothetical protein